MVNIKKSQAIMKIIVVKKILCWATTIKYHNKNYNKKKSLPNWGAGYLANKSSIKKKKKARKGKK